MAPAGALIQRAPLRLGGPAIRSALPSLADKPCSMSLPEKADSKPLRRRFSKRRIADALSAASKTGLPIRGFKISPSGEIDVVFGSRAEDQSEDLTKLL
jgi:hypothetical protein